MKLITVYYGGEWSRDNDIQAARRAYTLLRENGHTLQSPKITKHDAEPPSAWVANDDYHNYIYVIGDNIDSLPDDLHLSGNNVDIYVDKFGEGDKETPEDVATKMDN